MSQRITDDLANNGKVECSELLKKLRDNLRAELGIESVADEWRFTRIIRENTTK